MMRGWENLTAGNTAFITPRTMSGLTAESAMHDSYVFVSGYTDETQLRERECSLIPSSFIYSTQEAFWTAPRAFEA